jgi:hypothetical protein
VFATERRPIGSLGQALDGDRKTVGYHLDPGVGPANRRFLKLRVFLDRPCLFISAKFFMPNNVKWLKIRTLRTRSDATIRRAPLSSRPALFSFDVITPHKGFGTANDFATYLTDCFDLL